MLALRSLLALLALLASLSLSSVARAQTTDDDPGADPALAMGLAALTAGLLAFDLGVAIDGDDSFGPYELRATSVALGTIGLAGAHVAAFALLSRSVRESPRARTIVSGLSLVSMGIAMLGFMLTPAWAIYSAPIDGTDDDAVGRLAPVLVGVIGVAAIVAGSVTIATASEPVRVSLAASPSSALLSVSGRW